MSHEHTVQQSAQLHRVYSDHQVVLFAIHPFTNQNIELRLEKILIQDDWLCLSPLHKKE
jgi:hypothetical protein